MRGAEDPVRDAAHLTLLRADAPRPPSPLAHGSGSRARTAGSNYSARIIASALPQAVITAGSLTAIQATSSTPFALMSVAFST
jgi:hypothetical protein